MGFLTRNKIVLITTIVIVGGLIWYLFSTSGSDTSSSAISTDTTNVQDQSLVSSLLALKAITLTGAIFSNPSFQSLKDDSTQIVAEPVGRDDPFGPLGVSAQPTVTSTQGAQIFKPSVKK